MRLGSQITGLFVGVNGEMLQQSSDTAYTVKRRRLGKFSRLPVGYIMRMIDKWRFSTTTTIAAKHNIQILEMHAGSRIKSVTLM